MLGGALGNLIDRIFRSPGLLRGHVVDFVSVFGPDGSVFPVFNVADSAITIGGILLVLTALRGDRASTARRATGASAKTERRPTPMAECAGLPVPDGLAGMRVDAGLSRMLGLSRTVVADLIDAGDVLVDGRAAAKSDRLIARRLAGGRRCPSRTGRSTIDDRPRPVDGLTVLYADDDIVVVDKPVGVAAHPSPGWTGPTVIGGLAALGIPAVHLRRGRAAGHRAPARRRAPPG